MKRLLLAALLLASCKTTKVAGQCPEYDDLRCFGDAKVCAPDANRGCQVCHCEKPSYVPIEAGPGPQR